ncbi:MAG: DUF1570 domain-containing protein [Planctomycetes bacterium]|nr:DUF1570 domain-containing protein [Planctomycetota bacterium]
MSSRTAWPAALIILTATATAAPLAAADGLERVVFTADSRERREVEGRVLVKAADGGLLLEDRSGELYTIVPERLQAREPVGRDFEPLSNEELGRRLLDEFGAGFEIVTTRHYVICTSAGRTYAEWCGALFERLMRAFYTHWRSRPLELHEPSRPLVAIVFADADDFAEYATRDAGAATAMSGGYYSIRTNRMVLFDLTASAGQPPARPAAEITAKVAASPFNVATVVHEATHQIAFNSGMHTRYADNPLWLTEGMAMYFETPDLSNQSGWRTVGRVNPRRMAGFRDYIARRRQPEALAALVRDSGRFTNRETAADAYAEAWALTWFLIKTRRREYVEYLHRISQKPRLVWDEPEERLQEFIAAFGDLESLDRAFLSYLARR